ncbi:8-oxo-dGTP diphosphatase [Mycoplasmatota bacterium WC44]
MKVKLMNMCMIYNDNNEVLVQDRKKKYWSGIGFPGGHVELNESLVDSAIREVKEETDLDITDLEFCGFKSWDDEKKNLVILFKTNSFTGTLKEYSDEGRNFWVDKSELKDLNLANGFIDDLNVYYSDEVKEIYYAFDEKGEYTKEVQNIKMK